MIYTIFKGWHFSLPHLPIFVCSNEINKTIVISKEAWFEKKTVDDEDINKLFGVSFGFSGIHKNSFRIGWKPSKYKHNIDLYAYYYNNEGKHTSEFLTTIFNSYHYHMAIRWDTNNMFEVDIDGENYFMEKLKIKQSKLKFFCRPYHGGQNRANRTYNIVIKKRD